MDLTGRRRMLMGRKAEPKEWDYILYPWDGSELGWIATKILNVRAGQTVVMEGLADNRSNPWLYVAAPGVLETDRSRTGFGEFHFELPVLKAGKIGVSGYYSYEDGKQGVGGLFTYAYYIKIKII